MTNPNDSVMKGAVDFAYPIDMPKEWIDKCILGVASTIGLTKREFFASMAMQSLTRINAINGYNTFEERATACVMQADALIAELNKKTEPTIPDYETIMREPKE